MIYRKTIMPSKILLYNSLTKKKETFHPLKDKKVTFYTCGPTVYDYVHIGNLRAYIVSDILYRLFISNGYSVKRVMNITDVGHLTSDADEGEDKVELAAKKAGKTARDITAFYTKAFKADIKKLNITSPDKWVKATDHIKEQIALIKKLEEKGYTYQIESGVYFDTSKFPNYLNIFGYRPEREFLPRIKKSAGLKNANDFALWKFSPPGVKRLQEWKSPWKKIGFPGWHIECSAMSLKYLGHPIDIHTGGVDHKTVHHPNEIAQSEGAGFRPFVRFWIHNEHLVLPKGKMAKSKGTGITLNGLIDKGYDPMAFRYLCLNTHYRQKLYFSYRALDAATKALNRLLDLIQELPKGSKRNETYLKRFYRALDNDLNTPQALAVLWEVMKSQKVKPSEKRFLVKEFDKVLGLAMLRIVPIPEDVVSLVNKREKARKQKNWDEADRVRERVNGLGYVIKDTAKGPVITRKN